jgi:phage shock protein PspC (stress-responsive transcriptional regulator)
MARPAAPPDNGSMTYSAPHGPQPSGPHAPSGPRTLRRATDGRMVAGVAAGVARYLDVEPLAVRVAFVVGSVMLGGVGGPLLYALAWAAVPEEGRDTSIATERLGPPPWQR